MDLGLEPKFYINDVLSTIGAKNYVFTIRDSIHQVFPSLDFTMTDMTGLSVELGMFTRGVPFKIEMGLNGNLLESKFVVTSREIQKPLSSGYLGGNIHVRGVHESYTQGRDKISACYKKKASEIATELFPDIEAEETSAKLAVCQFHDSYTFLKKILLTIADSPTNTPFVFFRDLAGLLQFKSIGFLADQSPIAKLTMMQDNGEETIENKMNMFLPFDEDLTDTFNAFALEGQYLDGLNFKSEKVTMVDALTNPLPVLADNIKENSFYAGRQFNPDMDYGAANAGLWANRMRDGFLTDKALVTLPFSYQMVSGKVVEAEVFVQDENQEPKISEVYCGNWLIEDALHLWNGASTMAITKLVLSRSSFKPAANSLLEEDSYKGK